MDPLAPTAFDATFSAAAVIIPIIIVLGIVFSVVTAVRKASVLRKAGLDPFTAEAQLLAQARNSQLLAPERASDRAPEQPTDRSAEARLAEAQDLHDRGLITADELGEIRQRIIDGL